MTEANHEIDTIELTAAIVSAYLQNNSIDASDLPKVISSVHAALQGIGKPAEEFAPEIDRPSAAQIRKSVSDAGLVSFIDGKTYQSLKRHLSRHDLTPDAYRERYGLAADYPMVAPAYAARRSELAKAIGLGSKRRQAKRAPKAAQNKV